MTPSGAPHRGQAYSRASALLTGMRLRDIKPELLTGLFGPHDHPALVAALGAPDRLGLLETLAELVPVPDAAPLFPHVLVLEAPLDGEQLPAVLAVRADVGAGFDEDLVAVAVGAQAPEPGRRLQRVRPGKLHQSTCSLITESMKFAARCSYFRRVSGSRLSHGWVGCAVPSVRLAASSCTASQ